MHEPGGAGFTEAALDFRETAPAAATPDMFAARPDDSQHGARASGVPGTVAGLHEAHRRFGRLPWNEVVVPAERLALDGFVVDEEYHRALADDGMTLHRWASSIKLLLPDEGQPPAVGSHLSLPELAASLRRIAERGADGFYTGDTAALIVRRDGTPRRADHRRGSRRLPRAMARAADLRVSRPPRAHDAAASGGPTLELVCHLLEPYDLAAAGRASPAQLHLLAEALRRAFAARNAYFGDPDRVEVPVAMLLSEEGAAGQRATISPERASVSDEIVPGPGLPPGGPGAGTRGTPRTSRCRRRGQRRVADDHAQRRLRQRARRHRRGLPAQRRDGRLHQPARPAQRLRARAGRGQRDRAGQAHALLDVPDRRDRPDGRLVLVAGAAGGPRIISAVFQVLSNIVDFGLDAPAAVAAPVSITSTSPTACCSSAPRRAAPPTTRRARPASASTTRTLEALQRLGHRLGHEASLADVIAIGSRARRAGDGRSARPASRAGTSGSTALKR
jgi:gamma-glutamyltranspeptidase/glutathione hydrolase